MAAANAAAEAAPNARARHFADRHGNRDRTNCRASCSTGRKHDAASERSANGHRNRGPNDSATRGDRAIRRTGGPPRRTGPSDGRRPDSDAESHTEAVASSAAPDAFSASNSASKRNGNSAATVTS